MDIMKRLEALNKRIEKNSNKYPTEEYSKEKIQQKRVDLIIFRKQMANLNY